LNGYRRLLFLMLIMAGVSLIVGGIAISILYVAALDEQRVRLINTVQSQKYLMEEVARFNRQHLADFPGGHEAATLLQIEDAHRRYPGFGRTGGFALGRRVGDQITFVHSHRAGLERPQPVPFSDMSLADPMRRALLGQRGTIIGPDYRGTEVLAAFEPVDELNMGMVAKIDLAEVRAPFIRAAIVAAGSSLLVVLLGSMIFYRLSEPMIRHRMESEARFRTIFEQAAVGVALIETATGRFVRINRSFADLLGYSVREMTDRTLREIADHGEGFEDSDNMQRLVAGEIREFTTEWRYTRRDGKEVWVNLTVSATWAAHEKPTSHIAIAQDISERKSAEAELRLRNQAIDTGATAFVFADMDGKITYVNRAFVDLWGYADENEVIGLPNVMLSSSPQDVGEVLEGLRQHGKWIGERLARKRDGTHFEVQVSASVVTDSEGRPMLAMASLVDISRLKRAQQALRESEQRYRDLFNSTHDLICSVAPDGHFYYVNRAWLQTLQYDQAELHDLNLRDVIHADCLSEFQQQIDRMLRGETAAGVEVTLVSKEGQLIYVEGHGSPRIENGRVVGTYGFFRDVSMRHRAEQAVRASEQRLRAILNAATDAIITIDHRGIIQDVNAATEKMFGYTRDEMIHQNVCLLMPSPHRDEHDNYILRYLQTGQAKIIGSGREVVAQHRDGTTFPVDLAVSEVGHLKLFTGIVRDISEQKDLQRRVLEIAAEEQRRIGQELHDGTQQELTGLSLMAQNLADTLAAKPAEFLRQHGLDGLQRVAARLSLGLEESNKGVQLMARGLIPVEVDSQGLRTALGELAHAISDVHPVACTFQCSRTVELADNFTATHLYRIAQEAVTNALKHGKPESIEIALVQQQNRLLLTVRDNGQGIDPAVASNGGRGLRIMSYRAALIGATLTVVPATAGGTLVSCSLSSRSMS
jgi:two-component system, LuxR family, sensor kinase FixL